MSVVYDLPDTLYWKSSEFVDAVPPDCICTLCGIVSSDLVSLKCSHGFCAVCLKNLSSEEAKFTCPVHKEPYEALFFRSTPSKENVLSSLSAYCKNRDRGCKHVGLVSEMKYHLIHCEFNIIICSLCSEGIIRKDLLAHFKEDCENQAKKPAPDDLLRDLESFRLSINNSDQFRDVLETIRVALQQQEGAHHPRGSSNRPESKALAVRMLICRLNAILQVSMELFANVKSLLQKECNAVSLIDEIKKALLAVEEDQANLRTILATRSKNPNNEDNVIAQFVWRIKRLHSDILESVNKDVLPSAFDPLSGTVFYSDEMLVRPRGSPQKNRQNALSKALSPRNGLSETGRYQIFSKVFLLVDRYPMVLKAEVVTSEYIRERFIDITLFIQEQCYMGAVEWLKSRCLEIVLLDKLYGRSQERKFFPLEIELTDFQTRESTFVERNKFFSVGVKKRFHDEEEYFSTDNLEDNRFIAYLVVYE